MSYGLSPTVPAEAFSRAVINHTVARVRNAPGGMEASYLDVVAACVIATMKAKFAAAAAVQPVSRVAIPKAPRAAVVSRNTLQVSHHGY